MVACLDEPVRLLHSKNVFPRCTNSCPNKNEGLPANFQEKKITHIQTNKNKASCSSPEVCSCCTGRLAFPLHVLKWHLCLHPLSCECFGFGRLELQANQVPVVMHYGSLKNQSVVVLLCSATVAPLPPVWEPPECLCIPLLLHSHLIGGKSLARWFPLGSQRRRFPELFPLLTTWCHVLWSYHRLLRLAFGSLTMCIHVWT